MTAVMALHAPSLAPPVCKYATQTEAVMMATGVTPSSGAVYQKGKRATLSLAKTAPVMTDFSASPTASVDKAATQTMPAAKASSVILRWASAPSIMAVQSAPKVNKAVTTTTVHSVTQAHSHARFRKSALLGRIHVITALTASSVFKRAKTAKNKSLVALAIQSQRAARWSPLRTAPTKTAIHVKNTSVTATHSASTRATVPLICLSAVSLETVTSTVNTKMLNATPSRQRTQTAKRPRSAAKETCVQYLSAPALRRVMPTVSAKLASGVNLMPEHVSRKAKWHLNHAAQTEPAPAGASASLSASACLAVSPVMTVLRMSSAT